jgi:hypothetical protein
MVAEPGPDMRIHALTSGSTVRVDSGGLAVPGSSGGPEPGSAVVMHGLPAAADDRRRLARSVIVCSAAGLTRVSGGRWMVACARRGPSR